MITPYEQDIQDQPESLRAFATAPAVAGLEELRQGYDRIVLTGMGTSHFAGLPTWRALARRGWPAWWLDTTQLLDTADLVTPGTLLVVTSQSGRSAEVVALCDGRPRSTLVAVTNDGASPLARAADLVVPLHSGAEATVSTKSYLNSLAAHGVILAALLGQPAGPARAAAAPVADALAAWLDGPDPAVGTAGSRSRKRRRYPRRRTPPGSSATARWSWPGPGSPRCSSTTRPRPPTIWAGCTGTWSRPGRP